MCADVSSSRPSRPVSGGGTSSGKELVFDGSSSSCEAEGYRVMSYPNGSQYKGQIQNSRRNGHGVLTLADGTVYECEWKDDLHHGCVKERLPDGTKYEGLFADSQRSGHGVMTWPEGSYYSGQWARGRADGEGQLVRADGAVYYGQFKEDCMSGTGKMIWPDGDEYVGQFFRNQRQGHGKVVWKEGPWRSYDGQWKGGMRHGKGVYADHKGNSYAGTWIFEDSKWKKIPDVDEIDPFLVSKALMAKDSKTISEPKTQKGMEAQSSHAHQGSGTEKPVPLAVRDLNVSLPQARASGKFNPPSRTPATPRAGVSDRNVPSGLVAGPAAAKRRSSRPRMNSRGPVNRARSKSRGARSEADSDGDVPDESGVAESATARLQSYRRASARQQQQVNNDDDEEDNVPDEDGEGSARVSRYEAGEDEEKRGPGRRMRARSRRRSKSARPKDGEACDVPGDQTPRAAPLQRQRSRRRASHIREL